VRVGISRPPTGAARAAGTQGASAMNAAVAKLIARRIRLSCMEEGRSAPPVESFPIHGGNLPFRRDNREANPMRLRFSEVTFDPQARLLLRGPDPVHLTPKAFDLRHCS